MASHLNVCCCCYAVAVDGDLVTVGKLTTDSLLWCQQVGAIASHLDCKLLIECVMYCSVWQAWVQYIVI